MPLPVIRDIPWNVTKSGNIFHTVHTSCQPTLQLHNSYNRTDNYRQWKAVGSPDDGHKDAHVEISLINNKSLLLHLVVLILTYWNRVHALLFNSVCLVRWYDLWQSHRACFSSACVCRGIEFSFITAIYNKYTHICKTVKIMSQQGRTVWQYSKSNVAHLCLHLLEDLCSGVR